MMKNNVLRNAALATIPKDIVDSESLRQNYKAFTDTADSGQT
jgi:hypothetical protein